MRVACFLNQQACVTLDFVMSKSTYCIVILSILAIVPLRAADEAQLVEKISFESQPSIFPEKWLNAEINATATPIDAAHKEQSQRVLVQALKKYPADVLAHHLNKIYVVQTLQFYGLRYGGTNSLTNIYLCNRGFSDEWLEMAFHAEFSSLLLRQNNQAFDRGQWNLLNDSAMHYGQSGVEALKTGNTSIVFNEELAGKGFLYPYALSSFENDFNSIAENLMMDRKEFWDLAKSHPRIMAKTRMVMQFYLHINKQFDFQKDMP